MWYKEENITYYNKVADIPGWETMLPTADYDIFVFELKPIVNWQVFSFNYFETPIVLRYRLNSNKVEVNIFIERVDETEVSEEDKEFPDYTCSVWLATQNDWKNSLATPGVSEKYTMFNDHIVSFSKMQEENTYLGFYNGPYY